MAASSSIEPGFHAIHANHLEDLRRAVVYICRQNPMPPLQSETFLVQSNGIAQWLKLALAEKRTDDGVDGGLGIAAGMDFLFPARFIWQAYRAVLHDGEVPEQSPFDKRRLVWRLYRLLPELVGQDEAFTPLARFLDGSDTDLRNFQLAEKVADLFDQYQVFRADWLAAWEQGKDVVITARGEEKALDPETRWQPLLWRKLVDDVGEAAQTSRSQIHTRFMEQGQRISAPANPARLPRRIVVFGVSSLPRQALEALYVLSRFSQVVLCVHNPCQFYWADIISDRELLKAERKRGAAHPVLSQIDDPDQLHQHANPLLAAWGKQGRDYIRLLDEFDNPDDYRSSFQTPDQKIDIFSEHGAGEEPCLLHQLQNDIHNLTPLQEIRAQHRQLALSRDHSLVFHNAHGPQREVEILHDQLLAAFNTDPNLRPRDVIVMVPDINVYAPHIQAVFGRYQPGRKRHIPFTISDQGQRHHEPVLIALETLMSLPRSRFGVSEIISLLEVPGIRDRFDIGEDEIPLARRWVEGANIRWGLHGQHRESLELPAALERNTWQSGLRAMLLGYGMGEDEPWAGVEPYGEIGGLQASLAGRLSEFVHQLETLWQALQTTRTPGDWETLFSAMLGQFFHKVEGSDLLLLNRFRRQLEQWLDDALAAGLDAQPLPLNIVKDVLLEGLDEGGLNQRFLAGKVNFATLMPMRAIPFRKVCLLGMNDGDYPRSRPPVDFDLMAQDYRPGDRSRREDDRYLFLEALLSAREQLYISWVGRSIKDDSERPPSVLVGQLQDHLDSLWQLADDSEAKITRALTTQHPLQPFSRDYFPRANGLEQGEHSAPKPLAEVVQARNLFTYEREWRSAHGVAAAQPVPAALPYQSPEEPISLNDLAGFLKKPIDTFYQRRLQVRFEDVEDDDTDNENFDLNGLDRWRLDNELIQQSLLKAGSEEDLHERLETSLDRMARRGDLGMGVTEHRLRSELSGRLPDLFERYQGALAEWPEAVAEPLPFDVRFENAMGAVEVVDLIDNLRGNHAGQLCRLVVASSGLLTGSGYSKKVRYANLMRDWVIHLAGQLSGQPFETLILGKEEGRKFRFAPLAPELAKRHIDAILSRWMDATTRALPIHCEAGFAWTYSFYQSKNFRGDHERAIRDAEQAYTTALERDTGYLRGAFESPELLLASGEFEALLHELYVPLWEAEQGKSAAEQIGSLE
ncbi:exodeoxyribonuclease V subunit gamma [Marinobacter halophilus]|uniref:RecBCD enzyme subunit RecC n=1 Tax=Marinobacter halophilus TaxID=1323740 RepID=A0A2T1KIN2_9GAMM|nr:exodeoxyribonuclease V subunit gamma [Marinobacter halophilus]PSF09989.1 exodeoxyribonuclease V subunit gamma [Marinobacter halophilus]GGC66735.1 RecBCD enzyme subunit RecC [Marinobacter halophilus]